MKRTTKSILITALCIFCAGALLTVTCLVVSLATKTDLYGDATREYDYSPFQLSFSELFELAGASNGAFSELFLDMQACHVRVEKTDGASRIEFENTDRNNLVFTEDYGILTVSEKQAVNRYGLEVSGQSISFDGFRHLFRYQSIGAAPDICIYLGAADQPTSLRLNATLGAIELTDVALDGGITLSLSYGNVTLDRCTGADGALSVRVSCGSIECRDSSFPASTLQTSCGSVLCLNMKGDVTANSMVGNISYSCAEGEIPTLRATTTLGRVTPSEKSGSQLTLSPLGATCNVLLTTTVGNVNLTNFSIDTIE